MTTISEAPRPKCPGCGQAIEKVDFFPYAISTIALITAACNHCHHLLAAEMKPIAAPLTEEGKPPLWSPPS